MKSGSDRPGLYQTILGIRFYTGEAQSIIDMVSETGGLLVAPAAPGLRSIPHDKRYREALNAADYAIPDSAFMVLVWNAVSTPRISKLSGLKYLRLLTQQAQFRAGGASFWVMPSEASARLNIAWLTEIGIEVLASHVYVAPNYEGSIEDISLLRRLQEVRPKHVVLCIGGGTQEPLGLYLKRNLDFRPAIHCIGAAIAFLSGDQVAIPGWVDARGLGWLWRSVSNPGLYLRRYWEARHLAALILQYRDRSPVSGEQDLGIDIAANS